MAKRHFGEVITNYDPDSEEARKLFKKAKKVLKDLTTAREVCCTHKLIQVMTCKRACTSMLQLGKFVVCWASQSSLLLL